MIFLPVYLELISGQVKLHNNCMILYFLNVLFEISWVGQKMSFDFGMAQIPWSHMLFQQVDTDMVWVFLIVTSCFIL